MSLEEHIRAIQSDLRAGKFVNEAQVSRGVVMRLLDALGWPVYDTSVVFPEFPLQLRGESRRVDYALCHPASRPIAIIEVKSVSQLDRLEEPEVQLFTYAFMAGVQLAILTDGQEWHFYLPSGKGDITERRFYKIDLVERDASETSARLEKYLNYSRVVSGDAIKSAREDHDSQSIIREVERSLPTAWQKLLAEQDSILLELLAEKVADLCGYKPPLDAVAHFIKTQSSATSELRSAPTFSKPVSVNHRTSAARNSFSSEIGYSFGGETRNFSSAIDVLEDILNEFQRRDPSFFQKFAARKHGLRRRYISMNRNELYPGRPDLCTEHSRKLPGGWWMGTNYSKPNVSKIIELACEVAGVRYGGELIERLGS